MKHVVISKGTELLRVPSDRLMYISSDGNYSNVVTLDGEKRLVSLQLGQMEDLIGDQLGNYADATGKAYAEHLNLTINDIPLDIYISHNAKPELSIGTPDVFDKNIVFVTQAADIRADNGKINGAFVLAGKPMAWLGLLRILPGQVRPLYADL